MADDPNVNPYRRGPGIFIRGGSGIFVGLFLLALGVVLLLDQQGIVSAHRASYFFWPAVLLFFGLENLLCRSGRHNFIGAVMVILAAIMLLGDLGYIPIHIGFESIWPTLLIVLGISLVLRRFSGRGGIVPGSPNPFTGRADVADSGKFGGADAPSFHYMALMSGVRQRIVSKNFRRGSVTAVMGGFDLDFTDADLDGGTAVVDVTAFMGGGKLRVPNNWIVDMRGTPVMGGFVDERENVTPPDASTGNIRRLVIRGIVLMGGVVIKN